MRSSGPGYSGPPESQVVGHRGRGSGHSQTKSSRIPQRLKYHLPGFTSVVQTHWPLRFHLFRTEPSWFSLQNASFPVFSCSDQGPTSVSLGLHPWLHPHFSLRFTQIPHPEKPRSSSPPSDLSGPWFWCRFLPFSLFCFVVFFFLWKPDRSQLWWTPTFTLPSIPLFSKFGFICFPS